MTHSMLKAVLLSATIGIAATGVARADCEGDLLRLDQAFDAPNIAAAANAALEEAKTKAVSEMRKDDDACNVAIMEGPANSSVSVTAITQSPLGVAQIQAQVVADALGDLSPFRIIANDTLKIVNAGDLPSAKTRIKHLEKAWDDAEGQMRPRDKDGWQRLDKAIDLALEKLRAPTPDKAACADALLALIAAFDSPSKRT